MMCKKTYLAAATAVLLSLGSAAPALAHGPGGAGRDQAYGWHQGWHMGPMMGQGQMGQGQMGQGQMGQGQMGQGQMGQGQMGPQGQTPPMGYGMMGPQGQTPPMAPGMMGPQGQMPMMGEGRGMGPGMMEPLREDLSAVDVRHIMEHRLAWNGNPNVKVGEVIEKDDDTILAEIVTQDGSLVQKLEVDRHTGLMRPAP